MAWREPTTKKEVRPADLIGRRFKRPKGRVIYVPTRYEWKNFPGWTGVVFKCTTQHGERDVTIDRLVQMETLQFGVWQPYLTTLTTPSTVVDSGVTSNWQGESRSPVSCAGECGFDSRLRPDSQPTEGGNMSEVPELPDLPDRDQLLRIAKQRREHFMQVMETARAEVEKANAWLESLGHRGYVGGKPGRTIPTTNKAPSQTVAATTYRNILMSLAEHKYAGQSTLAGDNMLSRSTVSNAMLDATNRGHAIAYRRGRKIRYRITEAGQEFVTSPERQAA